MAWLHDLYHRIRHYNIQINNDRSFLINDELTKHSSLERDHQYSIPHNTHHIT